MHGTRLGCSSLKKGGFTDESPCKMNTDHSPFQSKLDVPYLLSWLKRTSINPCCPTSLETSQELRNQIIKVRKLLSLSDTELQPWRKRKHQQLLVEMLTDSDDLLSSSNSTSLKCQGGPPRSSKSMKSRDNIPLKGTQISHTHNVSILLKYSDSVNTSEMPHSSPNFIGDYLPKLAIPVGPRFQADIPEWTGGPKGYHSSNGIGTVDNSERWLGTAVDVDGENHYEPNGSTFSSELSKTQSLTGFDA